ncbi:MAG TPA: RodZ domain-containing protein [Bacteroidota bacterium]|nr:RodZ domain-containing protein [Bacteroidota bacterium]
MTEVFNMLRKAREERHLSLADVADATLINIEHLRAIDEGRIDILPEAYVRAFMREYASHVGLDPGEVMQLFDEERGVKTTRIRASDEIMRPSSSGEAKRTGDEWSKHLVHAGEYTRTVVTLVGLAVAAIIAWNIFGRTGTSVKETPFRDVVRENEERAGVSTAPGTRAPDSLRTAAAADDSLTLSARTTDSVWVRMMIDDTAPREYLFGPKAKVTWRGRSQFLFFTIGNGGAIELTLNGKNLGLAGKPGRVVQKLVVTRKGIVSSGTDISGRRDEGTPDSSTDNGAPQEGPREHDTRRQ